MIINLIGQPGAGKTTVSKELSKILDSTMSIDGDELREVFQNKDYSENGRRNNIQNAYNIARFLESKGFLPILSLVSPYKDLRESLKETSEVKEFYLKTTDIRGRENFHVKDYQDPEENFFEIDTTGADPADVAKIIISKL